MAERGWVCRKKGFIDVTQLIYNDRVCLLPGLGDIETIQTTNEIENRKKVDVGSLGSAKTISIPLLEMDCWLINFSVLLRNHGPSLERELRTIWEAFRVWKECLGLFI